jgi:hypothetical protein
MNSRLDQKITHGIEAVRAVRDRWRFVTGLEQGELEPTIPFERAAADQDNLLQGGGFGTLQIRLCMTCPLQGLSVTPGVNFRFRHFSDANG